MGDSIMLEQIFSSIQQRAAHVAVSLCVCGIIFATQITKTIIESIMLKGSSDTFPFRPFSRIFDLIETQCKFSLGFYFDFFAIHFLL